MLGSVHVLWRTAMATPRDRVGICQWFHFEDTAQVHQTIALLEELGLRRLRMDISWADYHRPNGRAWYDWLFRTLDVHELELLPCIWHTPPSLSLNGKSNGPPRDVQEFSHFVWEVLNRYGHHFTTVELWNEPNNRMKWDRDYDSEWTLFAEMIARGAGAAKCFGKRVVLGGMSPIDGRWLDHVSYSRSGALDEVDIIGVHAFPGQWNEAEGWGGWPGVFDHLDRHVYGREIWITEVGASSIPPQSPQAQAARIREAIVDTTVPVYLYCALDLPEHYAEIELTIDGRPEPLEHHLGLVTATGEKKLAFFELQELLSLEESKAAAE